MELAVERQHALGDVLGEVADPLEVVGDPQRADDLAQVDRHRLAAGDGEHGLFLDLALQRVDGGSIATTRCARSASRRASASTASGDLLLRQPAHLGDHAGELLEVDVEGLGGVFGHYHLRRPGWAPARSAEAAGDVVLRAAIARRR